MCFRNLTGEFIKKVHEIHGSLCCEFCGKTAVVRERAPHSGTKKTDATAEHLIPRTICNHDNDMNFRVCCYACNQIRSVWAMRAKLRKMIRGDIPVKSQNLRAEWIGVQRRIEQLEAKPHGGRKSIKFHLRLMA